MPEPQQIELSIPPHANQHLFSDHYLNAILPNRAQWTGLTARAAEVMAEIKAILDAYKESDNEAQTENDLVRPVLKVLGHTFEVQPSLRTPDGTKTPDYVFYRDAESRDARKNEVLTDELPRQGGIAVGDAKYWERPLDTIVKQPGADVFSNKYPAYQIDFYIRHSGLDWGILTNGKEWRLYHKDSSHKFDHFYAVDLEELVRAGDVSRFLYFYAFFRREAFDEGALSLNAVLRESADYALNVGNSLKDQVYDALRHIAQGFLDYEQNGLKPDAETLSEVYDNSLILLYRLIFILYAEARDLLPVRDNKKYHDTYSLDAIKKAVATDIVTGKDYLADSDFYWPKLQKLFKSINEGDPPLSISTFNGGLFDPDRHVFLTKHTVGDAHLQQAIDKLARVDGAFVDYRDLAVRHMGTIYEGLLEYRLRPLSEPEDGWDVELVNDKGERKTSGSYYTPDDIVKYIVEHTVGPVLERAVAEKKDDAAKIEAVLRVNVLDPAMGSGHFLVETTEFIARFLVDLAVAPKGKTAEEADLAFWKRRVVQACIYGVDLNPLAVELAKLSLWLTTVAKDRPLSFLDHHLRPGNSLVGARLEHLELVNPTAKKKSKKPVDPGRQISLFTDSDFTQRMAVAIKHITFIESADASDVAGVKAQEKAYEELRKQLGEKYDRLLNIVTAAQVGMKIDAKRITTLMQYVTAKSPFRIKEADKILDEADRMAAREHFFHWELEFPEIYFDAQGRPLGDEAGFEAVVGNPPWERIKLQENEFFASRDKAIALAPKAADRKRLIAALPKEKPALWSEYEAARTRADNLLSYTRDSGYYPLMGRGDTNLYALFAEKALQVMARQGRVGLLVPSGIATDSTTKDYFQHLVNNRMLAELLDFENREGIFPEVDSRFKFSIILMTGEGMPQNSIRCGFFLHGVRQIGDEERICTLTPKDFRLFNPNTLTTPIFRRCRDAELTRKIYKAAPVLVDKSGEEERNPWGVSFLRMFDMTNDSNLFRTAADLEENGFWLGEGNIYTKGDVKYVPLYEGKMVQMYDHRAATIVINPANLHRPAQEQPTTPEQHCDPAFSAVPQFWVDAKEVPGYTDEDCSTWRLGFKDVTSPTNVRTMIPCIIPNTAVGNTLCLLLSKDWESQTRLPFLMANLASFALDFAARQKVGGVHLNFFIVEQLPVLPPDVYAGEWKGVGIGDFVKARVLELCYTANDLKGFAEEMGYDGPPFAWDEERRVHLRAQLDALYFHLYGLTRAEASEIMDTFPIVKRQDEAAHGTYRTRDLIIAYYNAYAAGNMDAWAKR